MTPLGEDDLTLRRRGAEVQKADCCAPSKSAYGFLRPASPARAKRGFDGAHCAAASSLVFSAREM